MNKANDIAVKEFQNVIDQYHELRAEIDRKKDELKPLNIKKLGLEAKITQMLEALELKSFKGTKGGVVLAEKDYVNQPTEDGKAKLIDYLISIGELQEVVSFDSRRLCNWYKSKLEEDFNFRPPGLGEIKKRTEIRKAK